MSAPIQVIPEPRRKALHKVESLVEGLTKGGDPAFPSCATVPLEEALHTQWDSDAHATAYYISSPEMEMAPRLSKLSLHQIRELGGEVMCSAIFIDIDLKDLLGKKGKVSWASLSEQQHHDLWQQLTSVVPGLPPPGCVYATENGVRVVLPLALDVAAGAAYEAVLVRVHNLYFAAGIPVDRACKDWTRLYRLPHVNRDGQRTEDQPYYRVHFDLDNPEVYYIPEEEDLAIKDTDKVANVEMADDADRPSDEEALLLVQDDRGRLLPEVKKVRNRFSSAPWRGFVFESLPIPDGERYNTLSKIAGALTQFKVEITLAYALMLQAVKLIDDGEDDWRGHAWRFLNEFAANDAAKAPRKSLLPDRLKKGEGSDPTETPEEGEDQENVSSKLDVPDELITNDKGNPVICQPNFRYSLDMLGINIEFDEFARKYFVHGIRGFGPYMDDSVIREVNRLCAEEAFFSIPVQNTRDWLRNTGDHNKVHPVRDYLANLKWDGKERVEQWLSLYADAEDSAYTRAIGAVSLVACVRRILKPGCKHDTMLLLEGPQGSCKSSALQLLAKNPDWYGDNVQLGDDSKRVMENTAGKWIIEAAEVVGLRKGDTDKLKGFLSRQTDEGRPAYASEVEVRPRQFVLFGTTNHDKYLNDDTGNRRFWPVRVTKFSLDELKRDVDQLWAEAKVMLENGQHLVMDPTLYEAAGEQQESRETIYDDPLYIQLADLQDIEEGAFSKKDLMNALEINLSATPMIGKRVKTVMIKLGWIESQRRWSKGTGETNYEFLKLGGGKFKIVVSKGRTK